MATPTADSYTAASGATVRGGRNAPAVSTPPATYALVGDSLTAWGAPDLWMNGMAGGKLKRLVNAGWGGDFVAWVLARIDNNYQTAGAPGLAGLPEPLGYCILRIGTNNARAGASLDDATKANYQALFTKCLNYAQILIVLPVPPVYGYEATIATWNVWLAQQCAQNQRMVWIDDCANMLLPDGTQNPAYFKSDRVHWSICGLYEAARTGLSAFQSLIAPYGYSSPLSADPADVYPATQQWFSNPANTGSNTQGAPLSGQIVNGWNIIQTPSGFAGSTSIVAADVGDPIAAPWQRVTLTSTPAAGSNPITMRSTLLGRTITDSDPATMRHIAQFRFNNCNPAAIGGVHLYMQGASTSQRPQQLDLQFGGWDGGLVSRSVTINVQEQRKFMTAESSYRLLYEIDTYAAASGVLGSIDMRCINIRG